MDMESSVSLDLKVEPASPLWELELLDEVGEIWEGDVTVIEGELDVDLVEDVDTDAFWGQQDISELIGKEEQILGLELDEITLEDQDVKEEPFTSWLDNGAIYDGPNSTVSGLPTFNTPSLWSAPESPSEEKAAAFTVPAGGPAAPDPLQGGTADLFTEFEDVLSQAAGSLTPPDSPRSASAFGAQALLQLAPNLQPVQLSPASGQRFIVLQEMANSPGVNYELDELMAETYQKNGGISVSSSGNSSPISSSSSSGTKTKGRPWDSPSASSSGFSDSGYDDPEWSSTKSTESRDSSEPSPAKKRCLNSTEERRLRKKEQNKNAATRYRMKKKMEMEEIIGEEKELMDRHDTLKSEVVEITREIRYLKGLMGDLFRAKGLIRAK